MLKGALQPTLEPQQAVPIAPHVPHSPAVHAPPFAQLAATAMQTGVAPLWSQQRPALQRLSSQHGCPVPPHAAQVPVPAPVHVTFAAVQKLPSLPLPLGFPGQQAFPLAPQGPLEHRFAFPAVLFESQVPSVAFPQEVFCPMQVPPTQQVRPAQLSPWQQG
jgi:hypothetical protein